MGVEELRGEDERIERLSEMYSQDLQDRTNAVVPLGVGRLHIQYLPP